MRLKIQNQKVEKNISFNYDLFFFINLKAQNHLNNTLFIKKKTLTLNLTTFIIKIQPINIFNSH
jgi:hypothetical protein